VPGVARPPTAPIAAASLIAGYAVASVSGSRPLGGAVLAGGGLWCVALWQRRHGTATATRLAGAGVLAFALSHALAPALGAWPSVLLVSGGMGAIAWRAADVRDGAGTPALHSSAR
jgi:hypothetical protein